MVGMNIFLAGDVMIGRGIDQVMPFPSPPELFERYVAAATDYLALAERAHGPIPRSVEPAYVWGDGLAELERVNPALRIVNFETSITRSNDAWPKGINYRVSPENAGCLNAAKIDCCVLANNHVLDWGREGLVETLRTLERLQIKAVGAGRMLREAQAPAIFDRGDRGRVAVFAAATPTSGTPLDWTANDVEPGVHLLPDLSDRTADAVATQIRAAASASDIVVFSIHWGANWGYDVAGEERRFAHALIDRAGVSIVHGHSSHHPKGVEVYRDRLILYGCGDLLNDYEGISGREYYRGDLALMYFASVDAATGRLLALEMSPYQIRRFRLTRASSGDARWLYKVLDRESRKFKTAIALTNGGRLTVAQERQRGRT